MRLINTNMREHVVYNAGFEYKVPKGEVCEIPDRIAKAMMRRFPCLEEWVSDEQLKKIAKKNSTKKQMAKRRAKLEKQPVIELAADK